MSSPIHDLVSLWRNSRAPGLLEVSACRARLFTAATHEISGKANEGISYNPMRDARFLWACQWLDKAEDKSREIDESVEFLCHLMVDAPEVSSKHLAANDN